MLEGIHFLVNERGEKTAVQIELKKYGELWEDFYDSLMAKARSDEPRESLESVRQRLLDQGKLREGVFNHVCPVRPQRTRGATGKNRQPYFSQIEGLVKDPRPAGCRKLDCEINLWRIRIGDYRGIYSISDIEQILDVISIRHRRDAYR
jgi:mRNA-degrading endonuclease RelE of RelBE toxin-antitoxin system